MNSHEAFITIATYDQGHIDFLHDEPSSNSTSFMLMHEYGHFDIRRCLNHENHGLQPFLTAIAVLMEL